MEIKQVKIKDLIPAEYNPRQMTEKQVLDLENSIKKFGLVDPIIVNSNPERKNIIIGGHQRCRIAERLDIKEVPVYYIALNKNEEKELNLRLNKNVGEWDWDLLSNFEIDDLKSIGFQNWEIGLSDFENKVDAIKEWDGMPEFNNEDETPYRSLILHFTEEKAVQQFAELTKQVITKKTKYLYYPKQIKEVLKDKEYGK